MNVHKIKYEKIKESNEWKCYWDDVPTICAYGKTKKEAFINLMMNCYGTVEEIEKNEKS